MRTWGDFTLRPGRGTEIFRRGALIFLPMTKGDQDFLTHANDADHQNEYPISMSLYITHPMGRFKGRFRIYGLGAGGF